VVGLTTFRLELKYRVPPERVAELRRRLPPGGFRRCAMTTTYLDREDGALAEAARRSPQRSTKIRLRDYGDAGGALWMEVKLRTGSWTRKWRFSVPTARVPGLLRGGDLSDLLPPADEGIQGADDLRETFRRLREGGAPLKAVGCVGVLRTHFTYPREQVRFSLDENVSYYRAPSSLYAEGRAALGPPLRVERDAILELKDSGGGPDWCRDVVEGLEETPYSKFGTLLSFLDRG
jgi:hypothetical protein